MNIYPNLSQEGLNNSIELAEQQKKQRATEKNKHSKQTHDMNLAKTF